jgi:choline dehydrogenase-like flavoprotein
MYWDLQELDSKNIFEADICVVGAGAAGISFVNEFLGGTTRVFLLESGGLTFEKRTQELAAGHNVGFPYYPLDLTRFREFGGSTTRWGGACAPLNEIDFEKRRWVPYSGWPITKRDLEPYYARAQGVFEIGPYDYQPESWEGNGIKFLDLQSNRLVTRIWQLSPETNLGLVSRQAFRQSENVTVLLHANVTEVISNEYATSVEGVRAVTLDGKEAVVKARFIVLACGGIENARVLLLSNKVAKVGIGNERDLVGRFFMEHPHVVPAAIEFGGSRDWKKSYGIFQQHSVGLRAGICLSESAQRSHRVLNYSGIVVDRYIRETTTHEQASGYLALRSILLALKRGQLPHDLVPRLRNILFDLDGITIGIYNHFLGRNPGIFARSEQAPNPESRVTLSCDKDCLGQNKVQLDWRLTPLDKRTIRVAVDLIGQEFRRLSLGKVTPDEWLIADDTSWPDWLLGGYHHMGTTRMSNSPKNGVVDPNCQVHGVGHLYIAGSSVFPTAGYANPTLTIAAMSIRLADHLKQLIACSR